jgi:5-methylcytosine-specific restriction protein A
MSPLLPKRPCPGAGLRFGRCPNLIGRGEKYCNECMPAATREKQTKSAEYEQRPERRLMKSRRYREARELFLAEHPLCSECERQGRTRAATVLDHREPHGGDYEKFWDQSNWQSLCQSCHSIKTNERNGGFGNR